MSDWQPIETAPKDGTPFLVYVPGFEDEEGPGETRGIDFAGWNPDTQNWWKWECGFDYATHWMPLPEPPETTND